MEILMTAQNAGTLRASAAGALDEVARAAAPAINRVKQQTGVLVDQSGAVIDSVTTRTAETVNDLGERAIAYAKRNPLGAMLLALAAGALLVAAAKSARS
jgi:hypothetical protein